MAEGEELLEEFQAGWAWSLELSLRFMLQSLFRLEPWLTFKQQLFPKKLCTKMTLCGGHSSTILNSTYKHSQHFTCVQDEDFFFFKNSGVMKLSSGGGGEG